MLLITAILLALRWRDPGFDSGAAAVARSLFLLALLAKEVAAAGLAILPAVCRWPLRPWPHR